MRLVLSVGVRLQLAKPRPLVGLPPSGDRPYSLFYQVFILHECEVAGERRNASRDTCQVVVKAPRVLGFFLDVIEEYRLGAVFGNHTNLLWLHHTDFWHLICIKLIR